jgi:hybrid cluster-associated redox disulfide protein
MLWGSMSTFDKDMPIIAALEAHPGARAILERYGMGCCLCLGASSESIEAGAIMHSVDPDEVVAELNRLEAPTT